MSRSRRLPTLFCALACTLLLASGVARAQVGPGLPAPDPADSTTTTAGGADTSTTSSSSSTTTTTADGGGSTTTTTAEGILPGEDEPAPDVPEDPAPNDPTQPPEDGSTPPPGESPPDGTSADGEAPSGAGPFPDDLKAMMNSVKRSRSNNTRALVSALQPLLDLGVPAEEVIRVGFGRFPVGGEAKYSHDWWFPRFGPGWRLHQGTDIFAPHGTPVRAPVEGTVRLTNGGLGGLSTYVIQPDGGYVYLTHLSGYPEGLAEGQQVKVGDVVGYVGTSGNARGTSPHLHFEIHPVPYKKVVVGKGKKRQETMVPQKVPPGTQLPAVDPKAYLDQWIADAIANVPKLIAHYEAGRPRAIQLTGLTRRFSGQSSSLFDAPSRPPQSQLLWTSAANPTSGAIAIAEAEARRAMRRLNWTRLASRGSS